MSVLNKDLMNNKCAFLRLQAVCACAFEYVSLCLWVCGVLGRGGLVGA